MRFSSRIFFASLAFTGATAPAYAATHIILVGQDNVGNTGFIFSRTDQNSPNITIPTGDTITFQQNDPNASHNAVSDDGVTFSSGVLKSGPWTFVTPALTSGTYAYHCDAHVSFGMTGTITVQATTPVTLQSFEVD